MIYVDVKEYERIVREYRCIANIDPEQLYLFDDDKEIIISNEVRKDWKYMGLNTVYFIGSLLEDNK
jgi:hypothetical protein